jgi:hypothetical protein
VGFPGAGWELQPPDRSVFHGPGNSKYPSADGRREAVYRPDGSAETDPSLWATENFGTNTGLPLLDDGTHAAVDILPWLLLGNNPWDDSMIGERWELLLAGIEGLAPEGGAN